MVQIISIFWLLIRQLVISESSNRFTPQMPKMCCLNKQPMPDKTLLFFANSGQKVSRKVLNPQCKLIDLFVIVLRKGADLFTSLGCHFSQAITSLHNTVSYL